MKTVMSILVEWAPDEPFAVDIRKMALPANAEVYLSKGLMLRTTAKGPVVGIGHIGPVDVTSGDIERQAIGQLSAFVYDGLWRSCFLQQDETRDANAMGSYSGVRR